jgi:acyl-coenzyme A thioesterase 9
VTTLLPPTPPCCRRAFELAHATTYLYAGSRPRFVRIDEVAFKRPVDVGDLLRLRSWAVHSCRDPDNAARGLVSVEVVAAVMQPEKVTSATSNVFSFVFSVEWPEARGGLRPIVPCSEEEAERLRRCLAGQE